MVVFVKWLHFLLLFTDPATAEIYTLSLHDALPISTSAAASSDSPPTRRPRVAACSRRTRRRRSSRSSPSCRPRGGDRKSTRLNSSHGYISYAVFCLKKKTSTSSQKFLPRQRCSLSH